MADRSFYQNSNLPGAKYIEFKFLVDAGNAPTLLGNPQNFYISSVVRTSQGLYTITLADGYRVHSCTSCELNVPAAAAAWCQPGPVANFGAAAGTLPTVQIFVLNNSSAVTDPPAQSGNNCFISGTIIVGDIAAV
jgi:hypothetical protein